MAKLVVSSSALALVLAVPAVAAAQSAPQRQPCPPGQLVLRRCAAAAGRPRLGQASSRPCLTPTQPPPRRRRVRRVHQRHVRARPAAAAGRRLPAAPAGR